METWTKHITGASTLLQLRGKEQLNTALGRSVFYYLRGQAVERLFSVPKPPS
jgi:hypothetical protein